MEHTLTAKVENEAQIKLTISHCVLVINTSTSKFTENKLLYKFSSSILP